MPTHSHLVRQTLRLARVLPHCTASTRQVVAKRSLHCVRQNTGVKLGQHHVISSDIYNSIRTVTRYPPVSKVTVWKQSRRHRSVVTDSDSDVEHHENSRRNELKWGISRSPTYIKAHTNESTCNKAYTSKSGELVLDWQDGHRSAFHSLWLRDNCQCNECVHPDSFQKLSCIADIGLEHRIVGTPVIDSSESTATITWEDQHVGQYPLEWLREMCRDSKYRKADWRRSEPIHQWGKEFSDRLMSVDFSEYMKTDNTLYSSLHELHTTGIFLVRNIPTEGVVGPIAERIGPIRNTFYGNTWEVRYEPNPTNIASSSFSLPLHQDLQYFESPPGLQLLHCVSAAPGGLSEFIDGLAVINRMREEHPTEFETLVRLPVTYHYRSANEYRVFKEQIVKLNEDGSVKHLKYSPPWEAPSDLPNSEMTAFYSAYHLFTEMCRRDEFLMKFQLTPGDCVVFDNRRILHARTEFNPGFPRLLQGTYVDTCDFNSTYGTMRLRNKSL
ncbi:hypothetical protein SARC_07176 [Sphaeroforma arctica JP610]|uniref:Gamma-butyrobetaine dioxygenase n=1 Tax=Sphaeroforma arctica JP610 TaxID=667725 RepID=A0A0L0FUD5_9EUKA|nr:hypothetical protein SARC_07176 [Sphaeroforma arctica JP610]KNC80460.1 hypothetical protein SARC_07176 [Sphaeroforma arctica JP610]|eukprot:XP_014154362.1 hypothetical protein SARC_07176 [Sphaeroforma arctica JP610]